MNTIELLREFFGWCSIINIGLILFSTIFLIFLREPISRIHSKFFNLKNDDLSHSYFNFLAHYKIFIIVFNIVPYITFKIMS